MNGKRIHGTTTGPRWLLTAVVVLILALIAAPLALADGSGAVAWLKAQQNADGGFGAPSSSLGATADVLLAVASTGESAIGWSKDSRTPLAYLEANVQSAAKAGDTSKLILALIASGRNPRDLGGVDLIAKLEGMAGADGKIGTEADFVNEHCYAMIALSSARRAVPAAAIDYLLSRQIADGTWSWNGGTAAGSGDNNTAAMAIIALLASGVSADHPHVQKTLQHFKAQQNADGGFPYIKPSPYGTDSDSNSTAVVMWAIKAAGQDPAGADWKFQGQDGRSALDRMRAFQNVSGAFRWQDAVPANNLASTVQALVALGLKTLPFAAMDVGAPATSAPVQPQILPETGADLWLPTLALLGMGVALVGVGMALRRASSRRP
jgi:hypothetical protein